MPCAPRAEGARDALPVPWHGSVPRAPCAMGRRPRAAGRGGRQAADRTGRATLLRRQRGCGICPWPGRSRPLAGATRSRGDRGGPSRRPGPATRADSNTYCDRSAGVAGAAHAVPEDRRHRRSPGGDGHRGALSHQQGRELDRPARVRAQAGAAFPFEHPVAGDRPAPGRIAPTGDPIAGRLRRRAAPGGRGRQDRGVVRVATRAVAGRRGATARPVRGSCSKRWGRSTTATGTTRR